MVEHIRQLLIYLRERKRTQFILIESYVWNVIQTNQTNPLQYVTDIKYSLPFGDFADDFHRSCQNVSHHVRITFRHSHDHDRSQRSRRAQATLSPQQNEYFCSKDCWSIVFRKYKKKKPARSLAPLTHFYNTLCRLYSRNLSTGFQDVYQSESTQKLQGFFLSQRSVPFMNFSSQAKRKQTPVLTKIICDWIRND